MLEQDTKITNEMQTNTRRKDSVDGKPAIDYFTIQRQINQALLFQLWYTASIEMVSNA